MEVEEMAGTKKQSSKHKVNREGQAEFINSNFVGLARWYLKTCLNAKTQRLAFTT